MQASLEYIVNRLQEKSTWVALGSLLTGIGVAVKPDQWQAIMLIGMGVGGFIGTLLPAKVQEQNVKPSADPTPLSTTMKDKTNG